MNNSNEHILECADKEKDIGVIFDASLQFEIHMKEKISKASSIFALIRRSYKYLNITTFKLLFKSLVRSHLEYASSVWSPWKIKYIDSIENVQRRATKQIPGFKNLSYEERLRRLKLPSLKFRRIRGDMIETYKILCNIYDPDVSPNLKLYDEDSKRTRGNCKKLRKERCNKTLRSMSFPMRIINIWNSLPDYVINASSVNSFKNSLDKYWANQDMIYNYKCKLNLKSKSPTGRRKTDEDEEELVIESQ